MVPLTETPVPRPPLLCTVCNEEVPTGQTVKIIRWQISRTISVFCSDDCMYTFMAENNVEWLHPNPQPDVTT